MTLRHMGTPLVGIGTYGLNVDGHVSLPVEYVHAVRRAGGIPILLPPGEPRLEDWLESIDVLILAGGVDVEPHLYDGPGHVTITKVDRERDHTEVAMIHLAIESGMPTLAVCRGMQLLNVALDGDLHADIPSAVPAAIEHRRPRPKSVEKFDPVPHQIVLDPASRLASIMESVRFEAPSLHHQAVDELGDGLVAVGHAPDAIVEAIELPEHPFMLGVQWHPELAAATAPEHQRLFDALVRAAMGEL